MEDDDRLELTGLITEIQKYEEIRSDATIKLEEVRKLFSDAAKRVAFHYRPIPEDTLVDVFHHQTSLVLDGDFGDIDCKVIGETSKDVLIGQAMVGKAFISFSAAGEIVYRYCLHEIKDGKRSRFRYKPAVAGTERDEHYPYWLKVAE